MGPDLISAVITNIALQAAGMIGTLTPIGLTMANSFIIVSIVGLGMAVVFTPAFISQLAEFCMWATLTLAFVGGWDQVVLGSLQVSNQVLGMFIGGYQGPTDLFVAAAKVADRMAAEPLGWGLSWEGSFGALFKSVLLALATSIALIGLSVPGILALMAQLTLVVCSLMGPIIVAGMAFSVTRPMAIGAVNFVIRATVRVVALGLVAHLFATAIEAQLEVPGTDEVITMAAISGITTTAVFAIVVGFGVNGLAGAIVGDGVGTLGLSSFHRPAAALQAAQAASGAALGAAGAAARAGGGAAGAAVGSMARGARGAITTMRSGSPFG